MEENLKQSVETTDITDEDYEPMFKPRYWVGTILCFLGWITLIVGA